MFLITQLGLITTEPLKNCGATAVRGDEDNVCSVHICVPVFLTAFNEWVEIKNKHFI